jgi:hypothetical protein
MFCPGSRPGPIKVKKPIVVLKSSLETHFKDPAHQQRAYVPPPAVKTFVPHDALAPLCVTWMGATRVVMLLFTAEEFGSEEKASIPATGKRFNEEASLQVSSTRI